MAVSAKFVPYNYGYEGSPYPNSSTHISSSGRVHGGSGGSFARQDPIDPTEPTIYPGYNDDENEVFEYGNHPLLNIGQGLSSAAQSVINTFVGNEKDVLTPSSGVAAKPIVYSDWSPISRLFGMSQDTAFAEHMANTAHQREVADLKAAGLNPVLGISGSGAASVSGNAAVGSSSAEKVQDFPWMDVLGATAGLVTTLVSKKPALGFMVSNVFKAFD